MYNNGILDGSVDVTYVIHLEGNGRINNIKNQLDKYRPTKTNYILVNKGFKKCKKDIPKEEPPYDLVDAFAQIFKHAQKKNYINILILEDDFEFNDKMFNKEIINDINNFINEKENEDFMYLLGGFPHLQMPYKNKHYKLFISNGCHAAIYSKNFIKNILDKNDFKNMIDWDIYTNFNSNRYIYSEPLCYQLVTDTENSKYWLNIFNTAELLKLYMRFLKLDVQYEPGFSYCYLNSKILFYILLLVVIIIFYFLFRHIKIKIS
jgi:hypothetical protein